MHFENHLFGSRSVGRVEPRAPSREPSRERALQRRQHEEAVAAAYPDQRAVLDEFFASDIVIVGAPMYNFTIPSQLKAWLDLNSRIYMKLEDGSKVGPTFDERQVGTERLSSVQYLKFAVGASAPIAIAIEGDGGAELLLSDEQRAALQADLA